MEIDFANFNDVGFNTLKQSAAFSKIRANSKLFNTNIITNPTNFSSKFHKINKFIFSENSYISSNTYGSVRQHNLLSSMSTSNNLSTFLNEKDLLTFLSNEGVKSQPTANTTNSVRLTDIINSEFYKSKMAHEGGQMPIQRRVPKRGFKNINRIEYVVFNLGQLDQLIEKYGFTEITPEN